MGKKKKKTGGSTDPNEVRFCEICAKNINVGTGGDGNWDIHLNSNNHKKNASGHTQVAKITSFFAPGPVEVTAPANQPMAPAPVMNSNEPIDVDADSAESISDMSSEEYLGLSNSHAEGPEKLCRGLTLVIPEGLSPFSVYPFGLHDQLSLPWDICVSRNSIQLISHHCQKHLNRDGETLLCRSCSSLETHDALMGLRNRMIAGCHENTTLSYLSFSQLCELLRRKMKEINKLRLNGLNLGRSLVTKTTAMNNANRILMAIAKGNIPRVHVVISVARRDGAGLRGIIEKMQLAASKLYCPRSYEEAEFQQMILFSRLGGARVAQIAQRSCHLPSLRATNRRLDIHSLHASPGYPTPAEISVNLSLSFPDAVDTKFDPAILEVPMTLFIDELKLEERLRWDPSSNMILGVCREHGSSVSLDFRSMGQADALLDALTHEDPQRRVHFATEATVVATRILTDNPRQNQARPFIISGTCKHEVVIAQKDLIEGAITAFRGHPAVRKGRLYCIGSDGDGKRRRAVADITLHRMPSPDSPITPLLRGLPLFSMLCGADDITADIDFKHLLKRFRNTLLRQKGVTIDNIYISTAVLRRHLEDTGMASQRIQRILSPNDRQNVPLAYCLLSSIASLQRISASESDSPVHHSSRRVLHILGMLYHHLLEVFVNIQLSLAEQLSHLSAVAHHLLALYSEYKGGFMPVQLYFDAITMVKNAYFCVAKAQVADPNGKFWIILLGTDALESVFGTVRTMVGNDTNVDQLQLASRISSAVLCTALLDANPDWDQGTRRLALSPRCANSMTGDDTDISRSCDHISAQAWKGDVSLNKVVLLTCWQHGRQMATEELTKCGLPVPFDDMEACPGVNILSPFGDNKLVLLGGLTSGEREEDTEEMDLPPPAENESGTAPLNDEELEPDLEDLAGSEPQLSGTERPAHEAWISVKSADGKSVKRQHKASILRLYSQPLAAKGAGSKDRLKRIRGYSAFDSPPMIGLSNTLLVKDDDTRLLAIEDPLVTLLRCNGQVFLAIACVAEIRLGGNGVSSVPVSIVQEPNVRIRAQIMRLAVVVFAQDAELQTETADWEWTGSFEKLPGPTPSREFEGRWVEPINAELHKSQRKGQEGEPTYRFYSATLRAIAALLYERITSAKEVERLPNVPLSMTFPYRTLTDKACFLCESDGEPRTSMHDQFRCTRCPALPLELGSKLLEHIGAHILSDPIFRIADNPCGLCGSVGGICAIRLCKGAAGSTIIDMMNSRCPNLYKMSLKIANKSSRSSPCSNIPIACPLCPSPSDAVWKYNFAAHLAKIHPAANPEFYRDIFYVADEERALMMARYNAKPRTTRKKTQNSLSALAISEAHSSRIAMRNLGNTNTTADVESSSPSIDSEMRGTKRRAPDDSQWDMYTSEDIQDDHPQHVYDISSPLDEPQSPLLSHHELPDEAPRVPGIPMSELGQHNIPIDPQLLSDTTDNQVNPDPREGAPNEPLHVSSEDAFCWCGGPESGEMIQCDGPDCNQWYHFECVDLLDPPKGKWFCRDECRVKSGQKCQGRKRRRRRY